MTDSRRTRPTQGPAAPDDQPRHGTNGGDSGTDGTTHADGTDAAAPRLTSNIEILLIEAQLAADGKELDNPAQPYGTGTAEEFSERIENTDLEPAWLRPWENDK